MTIKEWQKLCRNVKNKGEFHILQWSVRHFLNNFKTTDLKSFYNHNNLIIVETWYYQYYIDTINK